MKPFRCLSLAVMAFLFFGCDSMTDAGAIEDIPEDEPANVDLPNTLAALPDVPPFINNNIFTEEKVELGRLLFWDPILSGAKDVACASCHHPQFAYADGRALSLGVGATGLGPARRDASGGAIPVVRRNAPTVLNTGFNGLMARLMNLDPMRAPMFWDARTRGLESQSLEPLQSFNEMRGNAYPEEVALDSVVARLNNIPDYVTLFREAFFGNGPITAQQVSFAISTFERSLSFSNTPFDRYARGDEGALSAHLLCETWPLPLPTCTMASSMTSAMLCASTTRAVRKTRTSRRSILSLELWLTARMD